MNNAIFIPCNRQVIKNIEKTVKQYGLDECYTDSPNEKIFKNNDLILLKKRKYIFLKAFCIEDINKIQQVRASLLN